MVSVAALRAGGLTDDEASTLARLLARIEAKRIRNLRRETYYRAKERVRDLGISIPPSLKDVETVVGWPAMAVDVLEERLDLEEFVWDAGSTADVGLDEAVEANRLLVEASQAHLDTLIYGIEFIAVSAGNKDAPHEPHPLVTLEPPTRMTVDWSARERRATAAASVEWDPVTVAVRRATLFLPDQNVTLHQVLGVWRVEHRHEHKLGRVTVTPLINRPRSGRVWGTSEITPAVLSITDMAVRTLLGMEVSREFYSSPQRYVLGANEKHFVDAQGNPKTPWEMYLGRFLALEYDGDEKPEVGQFAAGSPAPYLEQIKGLAQLLAAEVAMPVNYLGFHTQNPPGEGGTRALESRLVKRAERRIRVFGGAWPEVAQNMLLVRDGALPPGADRIRARWRDPGTPTAAATADKITKLIGAGVLLPDSEVTLEQLGFGEVDKQRILNDHRRARAMATLGALGDEDIKDKADALGVLIRAGVDPKVAAAQVGLAGLSFTGAVPVSLRLPERDTQVLEDR